MSEQAWKENAEWACTLLCSATPGKVLTETQSVEWCQGFGKWFAEYRALQTAWDINPEWRKRSELELPVGEEIITHPDNPTFNKP